MYIVRRSLFSLLLGRSDVAILSLILRYKHKRYAQIMSFTCNTERIQPHLFKASKTA